MKKTLSTRFAISLRTGVIPSLVACCLLSATLLVAPVQAGFAADADSNGPETTQLLAFEGQWQKVADPKDDEDRLSAIDRALRGLSWIVRRMASGVLSRSTVPAPELEFVWDGNQLYQNIKGENGLMVRPIKIDGEFIELEDDRGVPFSSSWAWTGDGLRVVWKQHQAHGSNVYRIDPTSQTLMVEHTIQVTAISNIDPIVYRSRFNRARTPSVSAANRDSIEDEATNLR